MAAPAARNCDALRALSNILGDRVSLFVQAHAHHHKDTEFSELLFRMRLPHGKSVLLVRPETASDVSQCVSWASCSSLSVSVVGGGHSTFCYGGDIVLDMSRFNTVDVNIGDAIVTVGGGATLQQIVEAASKSELMVPLGTAPTVGVGLILQGGIGHLTRQCGLALDAVVSAELVVADGRRLTVSREQHSDLFWALQGCGPNFGVVLQLVLSAYPSRRCNLEFWLQCGTDLCDCAPLKLMLLSYAERSSALPRLASSDCAIYQDENGTDCLGIFDYSFCDVRGRSSEQPSAMQHADSMQKCVLHGSCSYHIQAHEVEPHDMFKYEAYLCEKPHGFQPRPGPEGLGFFIRAALWPAPMTDAMVEELLECFSRAPNRHCYVHFQHCGGAIADTPECDTAWSHRQCEWSVVISGCWPLPDADHSEGLCKRWVLDTVDTVLPHSLGIYGTDLGPDDLKLAEYAFRHNTSRLVALKRQWDPVNIFGRGFPLWYLGNAG